MDPLHEQTEDIKQKLLIAFEDLNRLAHNGVGSAAEASLMAEALLERIQRLCQATRAALVLTAHSSVPAQESIKLLSAGTVYRDLTCTNIEEGEVYTLLASVPPETHWAFLQSAGQSWLVWRLPLAPSSSPLSAIDGKRPGSGRVDDRRPPLQANFLFGWERQEPALEQHRQLLLPLVDAIGTVLKQILTYEYIHELEIRADRDALREMEFLKAELLASVSHELRSPLTSIKGYASTLLRHERRIGPDERHEFLLAINEASDRLAGVIDTLLEMSELETSRIEIDRHPVDLVYLAREALNVAEQKEGAAKSDTTLALFSSPPKQLSFQLLLEPVAQKAEDRQMVLQVDRNRLCEVLDRLLDNAIKHTPTGGTVRLLVYGVYSAQDLETLNPFSADGGARFAHVLQCFGQMAVIGIQDSGKGIPVQALERIFDPFYRVDTRLARDVNGLGLGLAICRRIVELHHGVIWAESQQGRGSSFFVCLPMGEHEQVSDLDTE